ncbi:Casein kinase I hhp2 [Tritrichomonas foetus]|uniref:non-specific serine/threonine protein kinase n=1 Tax=Tritrichomonas foetus TaxID=1144522 RepID=A0A1J4KPS8_9EUKA|nr:Casein kinase I hhp2 [Tritrichomonas foetus]|eukprot:OHT11796.1 Casein kinase I hhp2 [Tritrichomonas foetus]
MAEDPNHPERVRFQEGKMIDQFRVGKHIGSGGYGDIYSVYDTNNNDKLCAMKIEFLAAEKQGLLDEIRIMKTLKGSLYFPALIAEGIIKDEFRYLVMELLGPSLSTMRRILVHRRFTLYSTLKLSIEMLNSIEEFHRKGFIHRDIKPGNFLIRSSSKYPICLIDFGLSEPLFDVDTHKHIKPNPHAGFTGTCRYASLNAHAEKQQSRRDDLWSWFYSLIELIESKVPWPGSRDRELTIEMKKTMSPSELCQSLPQPYVDIYKYIVKLKFKEKPDYHWIRHKIREAIRNLSLSDPKYDWELLDPSKLQTVSLIPLEFSQNNHNGEETSSAAEAEGGCAACNIA